MSAFLRPQMAMENYNLLRMMFTGDIGRMVSGMGRYVLLIIHFREIDICSFPYACVYFEWILFAIIKHACIFHMLHVLWINISA